MIRKLAVLLLPLVLAAHSAAQVDATAYPSRPVKITVGFAPGGATDLLARQYAKRLQEKLGQPFVVENKPGKGGVVAVMAALSAPADGYTIVMGTTGMAVDTALGETPYDWERDLAPIGLLCSAANIIVVKEPSPLRTLGELIAEAKKRRMTFGSAGVSSSMHMTGELFKAAAGVDLTHVPYRGAVASEQALLAGEVDLLFDNIAGAMSFVQAGKFRPIAITSRTRHPELPQVPTVEEAGLRGFDSTSAFFLMVHAKTPAGVQQRLESAVLEISKEEETVDYIRRLHLVPLKGDGKALASYMRQEVAKWKKIVSAEGFKRP